MVVGAGVTGKRKCYEINSQNEPAAKKQSIAMKFPGKQLKEMIRSLSPSMLKNTLLHNLRMADFLSLKAEYGLVKLRLRTNSSYLLREKKMSWKKPY